VSESKLPSSPDWYRTTLAPDVRDAGFPEVAKDIIALADEVDRLSIALAEAKGATRQARHDAEQEGYAAGMLDAEAQRES